MRLQTRQEITSIQVLERLAQAKAKGEGWVSVDTIAGWFDGDQEAALAWLKRQRELGHVEADGRISADQTITPAGLAYLEQVRQRRADRGLRQHTCRNRVLHWIDSHASSTDHLVDTTGFLLSEHAWFEGDVFTADEQADATDYLIEQGLLGKGIEAWGGAPNLMVKVTQRGRECVIDYDAYVAAYLASQRQTGTETTLGDGNTLALALGVHSTATATSINVDAAVQLAQAVRQASELLDLGTAGQQALADIEQRHDVGKVRRGLEWLAKFTDNTASGALGSLIGSVAMRLLMGG